MPENSDDALWRMLTQINETVGQMNSSLGASVEQNKTLFHRTDDHEERLRGVESKLTDLDEKVDALTGKVDTLSEQVKEAIKPKPGLFTRLWAWTTTHTHPLVASLMAAIGTGIGGYLIGMLIH